MYIQKCDLNNNLMLFNVSSTQTCDFNVDCNIYEREFPFYVSKNCNNAGCLFAREHTFRGLTSFFLSF